jgi:hypothetical protein
MTQLTFSPPSKPEYTFGKDLNLLPFELFNYVKAGRLHPLDKDTGQLIPRPDVSKIKKHLEEIEQEIKALPLAYGKLQTGQVMTRNFNHSDKEQKIQALDKRAKELPKERAKIKKELQSITNDWATYNIPDDPRPDFDILQNALFRKSEVDQLSITDGGKSPAKENAPNHQDEPATKEQAENYLQRNGKHWAIKFQDEYNAHIDHVDGLLYIAHILEKQGKDISDQILCQLAKGVTLKETIDTNEMIERNLSKGFKPQPIGTDKQRKICQEKYYELGDKLETASLEDQEEIKEQMEKLLPYLNTKKRNFADPNDKKAQSNVKKRIDLAYDKLEEENMPELAKHLKDTIKTGYYCRRYVGTVTWKIEINK